MSCGGRWWSGGLGPGRASRAVGVGGGGGGGSGLARGAGAPLPRPAAARKGQSGAPRTPARSPLALRPPPPRVGCSAPAPKFAGARPQCRPPLLRSSSTYPKQVETRQGARAGGGSGETLAAPLPPAGLGLIQFNGKIVSPKPNRQPENPRPGTASRITLFCANSLALTGAPGAGVARRDGRA